jgi:iron complex outermembrane receptor protein
VLDRDRPALYENSHRSRVGALAVDGKEPLLPGSLSLIWRLDAEQERLDSTAFGDFRRERLGVTLAPVIVRGPVEFTAGVRSLVFTGDSPACLGLARVTVRVAPGQRLFAGYSQNTRRPSYTELYYRSVSSIGNPNLEREDSDDIELGWEGRISDSIGGRITIFHRRTRNTVDWIQTGPASRWQASDLGKVETRGVEFTARFTPESPWNADLTYTILDKTYDASLYASRYALDYADHRVTATVRWQATSSVQFFTTQTILCQAENRARTSSRDAVLGRAGIGYVPHRLPALLITVTVENTWDEDFDVYPGQRPNRRALFATATFTF